MNAVVRAEGLCKRYRQSVVLDDLDLAVEEGAVYALVGPNGAGKTTTLKILMNIVEPTKGRAAVFGTESRRLGPRERQRIGYVSENQQLPEWMTVQELLAYLKPFYPRWDDQRARDLLRAFDVPPDRCLNVLSRGMRMKVSLASSLAYRPALLVLDEPLSGLDPLVRDEFVEGLIETAEETTMLIASHDLAEIEHLATHVGFLDAGRVQFSQSLSVLTGRFREIEVTWEDGRRVPADWPTHWLRPESSPRVVRFVDSDFEEDRTRARVQQLFGEGAHVSARAMSLRAIFVALARESRKAA